MKVLLAGLVAALGLLAFASTAMAEPHKLFLSSAVESADLSKVTLPLYKGTSGSQPLWYIVTDASSKAWAKRLGVNFAPRLAVARDTGPVQHVTWNADGTLDFPGTVDFAPTRVFNVGGYGANETGLPVGAGTTYGAVGDALYSPLAQLPDGTILNASHVLNASGKADKASNLDTSGILGSVTWEETAGFFGGHTIHYISVDGSVPPAAIVEDVTWAPRLAAAPGDAASENTDPAVSARVGIIAFTNGQTGLGNPNRQGLGSTFIDAASVPGATGVATVPPPVPFNIIQAIPTGAPESLYSPLWDVHLTRWDPAKVPYADRVRQTSFEDVQALDAAGLLTQPDGSGHFAPSGPVANCPIISSDGPHRFVIPQPN